MEASMNDLRRWLLVEHHPAHAWRAPAAAVLCACLLAAPGVLPLELGTLVISGSLAAFLTVWAIVGGYAVTRQAATLATRSTADPLSSLLSRGTDAAWVGTAMVFVFAAAWTVRRWVFESVALLDDDGAYLFSARLLAEGRLWTESPPMKLFFDRTFLINDGRVHSQYFLGWPALLVPGVWSGNVDWVNPLWAALGVPPVFAVARRVAREPAHARLAVALYASSPMVVIAAGTLMSHTANLSLLAWATWAGLRAGDDDGGPAHGAAFGALTAAAFWVRPLEAVALLAPLTWTFVCAAWRRGAWRAMAAFALPVIVLAAGFLLVLYVQSEGTLQTGYSRYLSYREENRFRFTTLAPGLELVPLNPITGIGNMVLALFRLNVAMWGWPIGFLLLCFAEHTQQQRWLWRMLGSFLLVHLAMIDPGNAIAGPSHIFEVLLPVLWLSVDGYGALVARDGRMGRQAGRCVLGSALAASLVHTPARLWSLHEMAEIVDRPARVVREAGVTGAVVFATHRLMAPCPHDLPRTLSRFSREIPGPSLDDEVIWLNHLSVDAERRLMARLFPDRRGYVLTRGADGCGFVLFDLEDPAAPIPAPQFPNLEAEYR